MDGEIVIPDPAGIGLHKCSRNRMTRSRREAHG